jgi:hypothetical protein
MCEPMHQFVHQRQQFLFWTQAAAQRNEVAADAAMHPLGQRGAHQAGAAALNVAFERTNVVEDRSHGVTPCFWRAPHHALHGLQASTAA